LYDLDILISNINHLANEQGISINSLLKNVGLSKSVLDNMKRGQNPSIDKMYAIADYFDVSIDYLLGRTDNPDINR